MTGAARYELWAWTSAGGWQRLDEGTLTATTYSHTELTAGTTYYYWVRAVNGSGEMSAWSERTSATVAAAPSSLVPSPTSTPTSTPPSTVSALSKPVLTAVAGEAAVELNWTEIAGAQRYVLWTWTSADGWQQIGGDNLTGTTHTHTGVTSGRTYYYTVRAVDTAGQTSDWSAYVSVTITTQSQEAQQQQGLQHTVTPTATATRNPRRIGAISVASNPWGTSPANVSWNPPTETPVDYQVNWARADQSYSTGADYNAYPTGRSYTITGIEDVRHKVRVRARYNGSFGPWIEIEFGGHGNTG